MCIWKKRGSFPPKPSRWELITTRNMLERMKLLAWCVEGGKANVMTLARGAGVFLLTLWYFIASWKKSLYHFYHNISVFFSLLYVLLPISFWMIPHTAHTFGHPEFKITPVNRLRLFFSLNSSRRECNWHSNNVYGVRTVLIWFYIYIYTHYYMLSYYISQHSFLNIKAFL